MRKVLDADESPCVVEANQATYPGEDGHIDGWRERILLGSIPLDGDLAERLREDGHTIAVTHAAVIRAAVVTALGAPAQSFWRIDIEPLSRIALRSDNRRWVLRVPVEAEGSRAEL